jgi:hypothetical protein
MVAIPMYVHIIIKNKLAVFDYLILEKQFTYQLGTQVCTTPFSGPTKNFVG